MKTILIADDEEYLRTLVRTTLEGPEYRILEATTGTEALELARTERPDLLVLDYVMPGMTGPDVVRALRSNPDAARIPFIMLTARGQDKDKETGLKLGAYAYMVKPFSPLELLDKVEKVLAEQAGDTGS